MEEENKIIEEIKQTGDKPTPRVGHTLTKISDSTVILFGGADSNYMKLGDT